MDVVIDAVESVEKFNIPLFAVPGIWPPPIAGSAPWPAGGFDRTVSAVEGDPGGEGVAYLNGGFKWWTEKTERDCDPHPPLCGGLSQGERLLTSPLGRGRPEGPGEGRSRGEFFYTKCIGPMGIENLR